MIKKTSRFSIKKNMGRTAINPVSLALLAWVSILSVGAVSAITPAHATISCAGYLPNSYFERIENNETFAGKLTEQANGTQQLQDLDGCHHRQSYRCLYINGHLLACQTAWKLWCRQCRWQDYRTF